MSDVKRSGGGPSGLMGNDLRDFSRGFRTKHQVKGAAGGARGVDYQDHEAEYAERRAREGPVAKSGAGDRDRDPREHRTQQAQQAATVQAKNDQLLAEMAAHNHTQTTQQQVGGTVQLKADEKKKKIVTSTKSTEDSTSEEQQSAEGGSELDILAVPDDEVHHAQILSSIAKILQDPAAERRVFGALALTDAEEMRKTLNTPVRVAKHLLVLAGRLMERGQPRDEVVGYLANTFLALGGDFGRRSYKDFAGSIGIGAVYPLEVLEKLIAVDDKFLPTTKCRFTMTKRMLSGKVKETIVIEYPEDLIITGFGLKGGGKPGYQLVPMKEKGKHGLRVFQPGEYRVLISGIDPMGFERLEEIRLTITGEAPRAFVPAAAPQQRPKLVNPRFKFNKT